MCSDEIGIRAPTDCIKIGLGIVAGAKDKIGEVTDAIKMR